MVFVVVFAVVVTVPCCCQSIYSGQAARCSRIAPTGQGFHTTLGQEHAKAGQEYEEVEHLTLGSLSYVKKL